MTLIALWMHIIAVSTVVVFWRGLRHLVFPWNFLVTHENEISCIFFISMYTVWVMSLFFLIQIPSKELGKSNRNTAGKPTTVQDSPITQKSSKKKKIKGTRQFVNTQDVTEWLLKDSNMARWLYIVALYIRTNKTYNNLRNVRYFSFNSFALDLLLDFFTFR